MRREIAILACTAALVPAAAAADECSAEDRQAYLEAVRQDVIASWIVPQLTDAVDCTVLIKQNFRGEVEYVGIGPCSDDRALLLSVVNAGYRASPMPKPDNPACFSRDLIVSLKYQPITEREPGHPHDDPVD